MDNHDVLMSTAFKSMSNSSAFKEAIELFKSLKEDLKKKAENPSYFETKMDELLDQMFDID